MPIAPDLSVTGGGSSDPLRPPLATDLLAKVVMKIKVVSVLEHILYFVTNILNKQQLVGPVNESNK